ncbi:MAG: methyltransferase domain-containing protein [Romboutsia sp.]
MISAVILSHNTRDTLDCIRNIELNNPGIFDEIVVVKNNDVNDYKSEKINIKNMNKEDVAYHSFSKLSNLGIKNTIKENDVLILTDNCYGIESTFHNLEQALYSKENIGIVVPVTNIGPSHYHQSLDLYFESYEKFSDYTKNSSMYDASKNELRLRLSFLTVLIKRVVIDTIEGFDEIFDNTDVVSDDFCLRALKNKLKVILCNSSFIYIKEHLYFNLETLDKNKFKAKWGIDSLYSLTFRTEIFDRIVIDKSKHVNILEIGCACGATLLKLQNIYKDSSLYGMDISKESIAIAKYIDDVKAEQADIESEDVSFEENKFDLIVLLDVLEHLRDPWAVLKKLKKSLKEDGQIIISLPNIMHISIINNLIQGRWDYKESGILDATHLRFFTLKSITELFQGIGCNMVYYSSVMSGISKEEENLIDLLSTQYNIDSNQLKSYQYIISNKG